MLEIYRRSGITLECEPKIAYFDEKFSINSNAIAIAQCELIYLPAETSRFIGNSITSIEFRQGYGLNVSDLALLEYRNILETKKSNISDSFRKEHLSKYIDSGADIFLFKGFRDYEGRLLCDEIIGHEIWHLIEMKNNIIGRSPIVAEGTATYASTKANGKTCNVPPENCSNLNAMLYEGSAHIIQSIVGNDVNPYISMLDTSTRELIQEQLLHKLNKRLVAFMHQEKNNPDSKAEMKAKLMYIPEFRQLDGKVNKQTLLKIYNDLGAKILATELENQDLSKAIEWFKGLGF